ncbi:tetratricopeptide repeat protein [Tateyamaria sp. ANG-S1]|uniref:tetratricopeptide repeat protein n=1 Tax=Tateyamaria sp. ANG-S1 TaxID=1577905 RepID=UPI00057D9D63|nr:tetratricopeptide repeat protein [Tateyamaria sp. ANG-S1]KIC51042.1 hypothetical protein RA29_03955 [Tateyamaria sp. ANG-S1]
MAKLVTQFEFEKLFEGKEVRPQVADQVTRFIESKEFKGDRHSKETKVASVLRQVEVKRYASPKNTGREKTNSIKSFADMHVNWGRRNRATGKSDPKGSRDFALGALYYFFRDVKNPDYFLSIIKELWKPRDYDFRRLYFAKFSIEQPWDEFAVVSTRFSMPSLDIREGFDRIWSGEPLAPTEQVLLGKFNLLLGFDEDVRIRELQSKPSQELYGDKSPNVFAALNWRAKLSKLYGRDKQVQRLLDWATDGDMHPKTMLVSGPGGVGKSRLAGDVVEILKNKLGWAAGELPIELAEGDVLDGRGNGVAVVVDYPEEDFEMVERLIRACQNAQTYPCPVRIILASRDNLTAWKKRLAMEDLGNIEEVPLEFKPYLNKRDGLALSKEVAETFAKEVRKSVPKLVGVAEWRELNPIHSLPLFLVAASIHAVLDPKNAFALSGKELLLKLAQIEMKRVFWYSRNVLKDEAGLQKLLALSLLTLNGLSKKTIYELGQAGLCAEKSGDTLLEAVQKTPYWTKRTEQVPGHLMRLQPDRPAAAFFYLALGMDDEPSPALPRWFAQTVAQEGDEISHTLSRISFDIAQIDTKASVDVEQTAIRMLDSSPSLVVKFGALTHKIPPVFSAGFTAEICERWLRFYDEGEQRGSLLYNLSLRQSDLGQLNEALASGDEAEKIFRRLARSDRGRFQKKHGMSLQNLAFLCGKVQNEEKALASATEAEKIGRSLVQENRESFYPEFANWLTNIASVLSDFGQHDDALVRLVEAIEILQELPEERREESKQQLAASYNNYANRLNAIGRIDEALVPSTKAVEIFAELATSQPDAFQPAYALLLGNLSNKLMRLERYLEALEHAQKAAEITKMLADARPQAFSFNLVHALISLAQCFQKLDRNTEALSKIEEAVSTSRDLAATQPDAFEPILALCLSVKASIFLQDGQFIDAVENSREAIERLTPHFNRNPEKHRAEVFQAGRCYWEACKLSETEVDPEVIGPINKKLDDRDIQNLKQRGFL